MKARLGIAACALLCMPGQLPAQQRSSDEAQVAARDSDGVTGPQKIAGGVANGPTDRALGSSIVPQLQLTASADEKRVEFAWSFARSETATTDRLFYDQFTFKVATELDKDDTKTTLLDLDGFPGGTELKLNYTRFSGAISYPKQGLQRQLDDEAVKIAQKRCEEKYSGGPPATIAKNCDFTGGRLQNESKSSLIETYAPELFDRTYAFYYPNTPFRFYGVEAGANQDIYKYLDRNTFTVKKASKYGFSATVFGGFLWINHSSSFTASFTYARRYEAQAPVSLCQAINATQTQCLTAPDGAPATSRSAVFTVDGRKSFGFEPGARHYAIAPSVSYDVKNRVFGVDAPFYLASDGEGKLRGGVRVGYVNAPKIGGGREDDATIALFVGVPFSLFR